MIQEIKYTGFSATPSDYEAPDGELAMAMGMVQEDGALKPVLPPKGIMSLGDNKNVVFIHQTSAFKHYIVLDSSTNTVYFIDADDGDARSMKQVYQFPSSTSVYGFNSVGNTILMLSDSGMHYVLWKNDDDGYLYLGTHLPELPITFGLQGEFVTSEENIKADSLDFKPTQYDAQWFDFQTWYQQVMGKVTIIEEEFYDDNKKEMAKQVMAQANKFIAENVTGKGRFLYPFFVRYAYRLFDGSITMHSAPVLMVPSTKLAPYPVIYDIGGTDGWVNSFYYRMEGCCCKLDCAVVDQSYIDNLMLWKDIVSSVDIFITAPVYTYDQSGDECWGVKTFQNNGDSQSVIKLIGQKADKTVFPDKYLRMEFTQMEAIALGTTDDSGNLMAHPYYIDLPRKEAEELVGDVEDTSTFFLLHNLNLEDLSTLRRVIEVPDEYLQSLVNREVMTDDYDSHDLLIAKYAFPYNGRVNVSGITKRLFNGFPACQMSCFMEGVVTHDPTEGKYKCLLGTADVRYFFRVRQDGKEFTLGAPVSKMSRYAIPMYVYYPNTNAYEFVFEKIADDDGSTIRYTYRLDKSDFLNGSYYFNGFDLTEHWSHVPGTVPARPTISADTIVSIPNKVYTSEVNNPFYFPLLGINTVGTGTILGICSAAKALSQGQFGQFPLYAFSTDGVWALEVSDTGTYSAKQPITRDVCVNPESITQIDSAVLFATDRGIMIISGSDTICISDSVNATDYFTLSELPKAEELVSIYNGRASDEEEISLENASLLPFREFLGSCKMVYDYINQRVIVFNPSVNYAYVYSLKSKLWGMARSHIVDGLNSYPEALAMLSGNVLADLSRSDAMGITALVVTRPFKLGQADVLKTIDTIIQRGYFRSSHVAQVLYGSRDLFHWHVVWSSADSYLRGLHGTPYKYFRMALICQLDKDESIYGCTVQFMPRLTNKPR